MATDLARSHKSLVMCLCRNDVTTVVGYLAALEAGHAVMLVGADVHREVLADLIARYRPELVLGAPARGEAAAVLESTYRAFASAFPGFERRQLDQADVEPVHPSLALMLQTSGTTGSPKFVRLSMGAMTGNARAIATALAISSGERAVSSLPLNYSYGLSVLNSHLASGACVVLTQHGPLERAFWETVRHRGCTSFAGVPYSYQLLERIGFEDFELPALKTMTQAGGKLDDQRVLHFHRLMSERGGRFFVMYGQTEATARISILPPDELPAKVGSVGRAIPGGRLEVEVAGAVADQPEVVGEIIYGGPNVMLGYALERGDLVRGDDQGGRLRTGDVGRLDSSNHLFITGRTKRISKVAGYRVDLDEVEARLARNGPTAVVGTDELIVAYCEYGNERSLEQLRLELARALSLHHHLIKLYRVAALPRLSSGKVDYSALGTPIG